MTEHTRIHTWMGLPWALACEGLRTSEAAAAARMRAARFEHIGEPDFIPPSWTAEFIPFETAAE